MLAEDAAWAAFLHRRYATPWVVYAKPPWGGPVHVLKYLGRYPHRVAIANSRLVFVGDGVVRFRYQDYAAGGTTKVMELRAEEFLRRFLLHVVPPGFVRIRISACYFRLSASPVVASSGSCQAATAVLPANTENPQPHTVCSARTPWNARQPSPCQGEG